MTAPKKKLFLSSTCYDLTGVRDRVEEWAVLHEYKPVLSDRSTFPVDLAVHRHDVCLANAKLSDLFVLVVSGRFGAPYDKDPSISVTWAEYRAASQAGVKIVAFVDRSVWDEREQYKKDPSTPRVVTKDVRTFEFLSEIQKHRHGYWLDIYSNVTSIIDRLDSLADLFPVRLFGADDGVERDGKRIVVRSLSYEAQHHIRLVIGETDALSEDFLLQAMLAIPNEAQQVFDADERLHGFSVIVARVRDDSTGSEPFIVRPTELGHAIRKELEFAFALL